MFWLKCKFIQEIQISQIRATYFYVVNFLHITTCLEVVLNTEDIYITDVRCGGDGTLLITNEGELYACGSNKVNI